MQQCGIVSLCLQTDCLGQTEFIFIKQIGPNWAVQILLSRTWCMAVICSICHQGHAGLMLQEACNAQIELQLLAKMSIMPWKLLFEAVSSPEGLNQHVKFQSGCFSFPPLLTSQVPIQEQWWQTLLGRELLAGPGVLELQGGSWEGGRRWWWAQSRRSWAGSLGSSRSRLLWLGRLAETRQDHQCLTSALGQRGLGAAFLWERLAQRVSFLKYGFPFPESDYAPISELFVLCLAALSNFLPMQKAFGTEQCPWKENIFSPYPHIHLSDLGCSLNF